MLNNFNIKHSYNQVGNEDVFSFKNILSKVYYPLKLQRLYFFSPPQHRTATHPAYSHIHKICLVVVKVV